MDETQPITVPKEFYPVKIISWQVNPNDEINKDQALGICEYDELSSSVNGLETKPRLVKREIRSLYQGKIISLLDVGSISESQMYFIF